MSSFHRYTWGAQDSLSGLAARFLQQSGWQDRDTFETQIINANPTYPSTVTVPSSTDPGQTVELPVLNNLYDWEDGNLVGVTVLLPFAT